jgi:hypothetical protein
MKYKLEHLFCSPRLLANIPEVGEIYDCVDAVKWEPDFEQKFDSKSIKHQAGYNAAPYDQFVKIRSWEAQPLLSTNPKLIGDFKKSDIFIEVQFGNSSTIYRDYYKFHYGLSKSLLSLAVLIVPVEPKKFFPTRPGSVQNMAEFDMALKYFKLLPIPVPILLLGLLPEN